jgi:hypothetical protein
MDKRDFLKMMGAGAVAGVAGGWVARQGYTSPGLAPHIPDIRAARKETSFERIQRTQTIRVSYAPYAPNVMVDPNTRQMSGIFYDIVNLIGQYLGMKIQWTEEVGWVKSPRDLSRENMTCAGRMYGRRDRARCRGISARPVISVRPMPSFARMKHAFKPMKI